MPLAVAIGSPGGECLMTTASSLRTFSSGAAPRLPDQGENTMLYEVRAIIDPATAEHVS
jgi:hypothetical protein